MSLATLDLPSDVAELRALAVALQASLVTTETALANTTVELSATAAELATSTAELRAAKASIQLTALEIAKLKAQIAKLMRMQFGQSSERLSRTIGQLELRLEDLDVQEAEISAAVAAGVPEPETRKARRLPLPGRLPRRDVVHAAPGADGFDCGGKMTPLGESIREVLEYVPGRFEVVRHVRPKLACQRCDAISQAPAPALPIPRGKAGPALLAPLLVLKYAITCPSTAGPRSTPATVSRLLITLDPRKSRAINQPGHVTYASFGQ